MVSSETKQGVVLVNDMIPGFLLANWDTLMKGRAVRFRYLVIPRLETIEFKLDKTEQTQWEGRWSAKSHRDCYFRCNFFAVFLL
jgi:hypothetical protein